MSRRLVLLRHGRTDWNLATRIQGQIDSDLDEVGVAQAAAVAPVIAALRPSVIWSSDLTRARRTAEAVAAACGLAPSFDARLREFHLGERQGLTHEEYAELAPEEFARFRAGEWSEIPGAEHPSDVAARFVAAMMELVAGVGPDGLGVVVSHGAAIRTGLVAFLGWPLRAALDLRALGNCGRVVLEQRESGTWALAAYNLAVDA